MHSLTHRLLNIVLASVSFLTVNKSAFSQTTATSVAAIAQPAQHSLREHLCMDLDWRFALGHATDAAKDFSNGTSYFSYFAKTGYGDGAAAPNFDDRAWRKIDLPHDWAVELPFSSRASTSHGFKAIGRNFPENSIGWYRKRFSIPATDLGKKISLAFDGVFRNSIVWLNGHYLGTEPSGYNSFQYDISEFLNYGGENVIAVRVDATMEEGWFYEGAGIYRHVWLNKTAPLHIATNGAFVSSKLNDQSADVSAALTIQNADEKPHRFYLIQKILGTGGHILAVDSSEELSLPPFSSREWSSTLTIDHPSLWSVDSPHLYHLISTLIENGEAIDSYDTRFGIRSIRFTPDSGFFLNGRRFEIKGTNNHQDHAGVGTALPDALINFRIRTLKSLGSNTIRCSHNPPTPEFLDACDSLGMLVIDENRSMGISATQLGDLKQLIVRDRNHPSVISWSIGNEEWDIENNIVGARIATTMQAYAKSIDSTRFITYAFSGGVGSGISNVMDVLGYNYVGNKNTDEHHLQYPAQCSWGTEESSNETSRGIYFDDSAHHQLVSYDRRKNADFLSLEEGWKYYVARPYLAGMCVWSGFDYRGEPTPFGWPSIESYFGMLDACGFLKDDAWYLRTWWTPASTPLVHLLPHWTSPGKEGRPIRVVAYSNCEEVELFLNKKSLGRKKVLANGHLEWLVNYSPGLLKAVAYKKDKPVAEDKQQTTTTPSSIALSADKPTLIADKKDITLITVQLKDRNGLPIATAGDTIRFYLSGPGKILGVGNGNSTSLEPDQFHEHITTTPLAILNKQLTSDSSRPEIISGSFTLPPDADSATLTFFYKSIGQRQSIYVNDRLIGQDLPAAQNTDEFRLDHQLVHPGKNSFSIQAIPFVRKHSWDVINEDPGLIQLIYPAHPWQRALFNGLAQLIIQSTGDTGTISVRAAAPNVTAGEIKISTISPAHAE